MKRFYLTVLFIYFSFSSSLLPQTPYRSINENNYHDVIKNLKKPKWLARYAYYNFIYYSDETQYGEVAWEVTGKTIFQTKKGDCEDWAEFYKDVLNYHNIQAEIYEVYTMTAGHAICIFKYKGKWGYLDSTKLYSYDFDSKSETILDYFKTNTLFTNPKNYIIDEDRPLQKKKSYYIGINRLNLDKHVTKSEYGLHIFYPGIPYYSDFSEDKWKSYKSYYESLHKEAIGYLYNLDKYYINGIGGSFSTHGYYSSFVDSDKMGSLYITGLNSIIGIAGYFGDYNGIDIDFKLTDYSFLESYLCIRNFEAWDAEINIKPFDFGLIFNLEKWDKDYVYGINYSLIKEEEMGLILKINNKQSGLVIDLNNMSFDINYSYNDNSLVDFNIRIGI